MKVLHSICNMDTRGLPVMFTLSPQACGPRALGVHITQTTHTHVTSTKLILLVGERLSKTFNLCKTFMVHILCAQLKFKKSYF